MRLDGKVALITGGTSGIGRATAILFARRGAKVVVVGRNRKKGEETVKSIKKEGGETEFVQADVSRSADVKRMVVTAVEKYGKLDILFNNAGVFVAKTTAETTEEEWDRVIGVNLKGVFLGSKFAIPQMIKQGGGCIINTSSVSGLKGSPYYAAYCASKGGVILFTKALAAEVAKYGIRVNCVCPGDISTPMLDEEINISLSLHKTSKKQVLQSKIAKIPLKKIGSPDDVANAVLFLASDEAAYVTGVALIIDGGKMAKS